MTAAPSRFAAESDSINVGEFKIYDDDSLPHAVTIKAIAAAPDGTTTPLAARTYFFQEKETAAVISIATDYENLLNYYTGIMVKGAFYDSWINTPEAQPILENEQIWWYQGNYTQKGKAWERPATIEVFDGSTYLIENCGIRLRGGTSRMYSQKPFNIYFRKEYGARELTYALFEDAVDGDGNTIPSYKDILLRNGGNDTEYLKFHDALIQYLVKDLDLTTSSSRPAVLYLNGEYMGIYVMQEKYSDKFVADHYQVEKDNVIIIDEGAVDEGEDSDIALYENMQAYAERDLSEQSVFDEFCNVVDIDSMIDYYATQIYIGNADWHPTKNTRLWRVRTPENDSYGDGRWRWMLYDMEYSSSLYEQTVTQYDFDSFSETLKNDPLFAGLMKNTVFHDKFVEKIQYLADNNFSKENVDQAFDHFTGLYKDYMPLYYKRFGDTEWAYDSNIHSIKEFFENRLTYIMKYISDYQGM